jgi:peptidoglycan-N-acetylglucosamine deacetylase
MLKPETVLATHSMPIHMPVQVQRLSRSASSVERIVTTSWDDGDPNDLRVAEMLTARRLAGTFYLPVKGHHRSCRMGAVEMLELDAQGFEIGAHGVSHPNLPRCDPHQLMVEVESSKKRLEDDLGKDVSMFAYPRGRHNGKVIASLKNAGYSGARTTAMLAQALTFDPFRMPTSSHVFPHSRLDYLRNLVRAFDARRAWVYAAQIRRVNNWVDLAKILFDWVLQNGGFWHLYGHSWEIEELRLWGGLNEILVYVSNRPGVSYVSNRAAVEMQTTRLARTSQTTLFPSI